MQRLEVSGALRPIYGSLDVKRLIYIGGSHVTKQADSRECWIVSLSNLRIHVKCIQLYYFNQFYYRIIMNYK